MSSSLVIAPLAQFGTLLGEDTVTVARNYMQVAGIKSGYRYLIIYIETLIAVAADDLIINFNNDYAAHYSYLAQNTTSLSVLPTSVINGNNMIIGQSDINYSSLTCITVYQNLTLTRRICTVLGGTPLKSTFACGNFDGNAVTQIDLATAAARNFLSGSKVTVYGVN
jgi:hypothetical protein